jgi:glutamate racemase
LPFSALPSETVKPLSTIVLGCTRFPLVEGEIDVAFSSFRRDPGFAPHIAETRHYVDPAEWTARQLFRELAGAKLRRRVAPDAAEKDHFFLSVAD